MILPERGADNWRRSDPVGAELIDREERERARKVRRSSERSCTPT
jgi:hypothetical protein